VLGGHQSPIAHLHGGHVEHRDSFDAATHRLHTTGRSEEKARRSKVDDDMTIYNEELFEAQKASYTNIGGALLKVGDFIQFVTLCIWYR